MRPMRTTVTIELDAAVHREYEAAARRRGVTVAALLAELVGEHTPAAPAGTAAASWTSASSEADRRVERMIGSGKLREPPAETDGLYERLKRKYIHPEP